MKGAAPRKRSTNNGTCSETEAATQITSGAWLERESATCLTSASDASTASSSAACKELAAEAIATMHQTATFMTSNDRVERPATMTVPRPDAAHDVSRSAPTRS
jgi:hypothetical protein